MAQATTGELKIESGVPRTRKGARNENTAVIKKMKVGDSVFFPDKTGANAFVASVNAQCRETNHHGSIRAVDGGWRVWKVERKPNGETP